jgi:hypothetical protein
MHSLRTVPKLLLRAEEYFFSFAKSGTKQVKCTSVRYISTIYIVRIVCKRSMYRIG